MSGIATAIIGGSIIGAKVSSDSTKKQLKAQREAQASAEDIQTEQFEATQEAQLPFQQAGVAALGQQRQLIGLGAEGATPEEAAQQQQAAISALEVSPGQQFLRDRAQKNLLRNAAAIGGLGGGNVRSELVQQGVGFAQQDLQNQFGRLGQLAGQGQAAATSVGQFGQATAGNLSNLALQGGQNRVSALQQQNAANQQVIQGGLQALGASGIFGQPAAPTLSPARSQFITG